MQGAENLTELQAYLTWYDATPPDPKSGSPDVGKEHSLPHVPLDRDTFEGCDIASLTAGIQIYSYS